MRPDRVGGRRGPRFGVVGACAALAVAAAACRAPELPVLSTVPAFTLVDQHGKPFGSDDLRGRVWIADFVFTRCPDVCPAITARMRAVQDRLPPGDDGVRLVSISVDPLHDTPDVLAAYAARFGAGPGWVFLTGPRDAIATILRDGFKVAFADDGPATAPITHSDRFVLVDRALRVRRYYHGTGDEPLDDLVADARRLQAGG